MGDFKKWGGDPSNGRDEFKMVGWYLFTDYENTKFNTLKTKVNSLQKKIPHATTLIHKNQYNTDKGNLEKKIEMLIKNTRHKQFSDHNCFEYKN